MCREAFPGNMGKGIYGAVPWGVLSIQPAGTAGSSRLSLSLFSITAGYLLPYVLN